MLSLTKVNRTLNNINFQATEPVIQEYIEPVIKKYVYELVEIFPPTCPVCNKIILKKDICQLPHKLDDCPVSK